MDASVFRLRPLPGPDSLPRHLSEAESHRLEAHVRSRMTPGAAPEERLLNACFFVLAHAGLRISECANLQYQDLDLAGQRLFVRLGKEQEDRCVSVRDRLPRLARLSRPNAAGTHQPLVAQDDGSTANAQLAPRHRSPHWGPPSRSPG